MEQTDFLSVYHETSPLATKTALFLRRTENPRKTAYDLLARGVAQFFGQNTLPEIARTPLGQPYFPALPQCRFSISHSRHYALCALSGGRVGCDVEELKPRLASLPERCFSPAELERWRAMGGGWEGFYPLWTEKEAAGKYLGTGLRGDLRAISPPPGTRVSHFRVGDAFLTLCSDMELAFTDGI